MAERIVTSIWWLLLMGFVGASGIAGAAAGFRGITEMLAGRWLSGTTALALALTAGTCTWLACRHRTDLLTG